MKEISAMKKRKFICKICKTSSNNYKQFNNINKYKFRI